MVIRLIHSYDTDFKKVMDIRSEVFISEQGVPAEEEFDSYDERHDTVYCLVYDEVPCATARLIFKDGGYKIGRVATLKEHRRKGLGAAAVSALCEEAFKKGAPYISLEAQLHAIPFYESLGFEVVSDEVFLDAGIEHKLMRKYYG